MWFIGWVVTIDIGTVNKDDQELGLQPKSSLTFTLNCIVLFTFGKRIGFVETHCSGLVTLNHDNPVLNWNR